MVDSPDEMYGINPLNKDVSDFHSRRSMFAIKDDSLYFAEPHVSYSHAKWFNIEGWLDSDKDAIDNIVRGYVDDEGVYFYKGLDFNVDSWSEAKMLSYLGGLTSTLHIDPNLHLYGGVIRQDKPGKWPVRKDYGKIRDLLK